MNLGKIIKKLWKGEIKPTLILLTASLLTYITAYAIGYYVVKKETINNNAESSYQRIERMNYLFGTDIFEHFKLNVKDPGEEYIYERKGIFLQQSKKYVDGGLPNQKFADGNVDEVRLEKCGPIDLLIYTIDNPHGIFYRTEDEIQEKEIFEEADNKLKELKEKFSEYLE